MEKLIKWVTSLAPVVSILVIVAAVLLWKLFIKLYSKVENKAGKSGKSVASVIKSIIKYALWIISILIVLQVNGVNVGSLLAGLGIVSVILGLALQDAIKDMIMGLHILSDDFFDIGDVVKIDGTEGVVKSFTLRTTKIQNILNDDIYVICNRDIEKITVSSRLVDADVSLSYTDDPDRVRAVMTDLAEKIRTISGIDNCVFKGTSEFTDSAVIYKLRFWCNPENRGDIKRAVNAMIQDTVKAENLHIPYNQLDVHVK